MNYVIALPVFFIGVVQFDLELVFLQQDTYIGL